jgi:hypothetical protein
VRVQAFRPEASIEGFDVGVASRFTRPGEVRGDVVGVGPQIEIAGDEFLSLIDADGLRIACRSAESLKRVNDVLSAVADEGIQDRHIAREKIDDRQHANLTPGSQLIMNKIHRPGFVRLRRIFAIVVSEFRCAIAGLPRVRYAGFCSGRAANPSRRSST